MPDQKFVCVAVGRAKAIAGVESNTIVTEAHDRWTNGWVAIVRRDKDFGTVISTYIRGDRSGLNRAGNGEIVYSNVADGYYEAESVIKSLVAGRRYFKIAEGEVMHFESEDELIASMWDTTVEEIVAAAARRKQAHIDAENQLAALLKNELKFELPLLKGSPKQIAWAETLRVKAIAALQEKVDYVRNDEKQLQKLTEEVRKAINTDIDPDQIILKLDAYLADLAKNQESRYWIDKRSNNHSQDMYLWLIRHLRALA